MGKEKLRNTRKGAKSGQSTMVFFAIFAQSFAFGVAPFVVSPHCSRQK
jgi:hypothetical protein